MYRPKFSKVFEEGGEEGKFSRDRPYARDTFQNRIWPGPLRRQW